MLQELTGRSASIGVCLVTQAAKVLLLKFLSSEAEQKRQQHSAKFFIPTHSLLRNSLLNL